MVCKLVKYFVVVSSGWIYSMVTLHSLICLFFKIIFIEPHENLWYKNKFVLGAQEIRKSSFIVGIWGTVGCGVKDPQIVECAKWLFPGLRISIVHLCFFLFFLVWLDGFDGIVSFKFRNIWPKYVNSCVLQKPAVVSNSYVMNLFVIQSIHGILNNFLCVHNSKALISFIVCILRVQVSQFSKYTDQE